MPYFAIVIAGGIVIAVGLILRKSLAGRFVVPTGLVIGVGGFALGLGLGCGLMYEFGYRWSKQPVGSQAPMVLPNDSQMQTVAKPPLEPGDEVPELRAKGWLNGLPANLKLVTGQVIVLDIWAQW